MAWKLLFSTDYGLMSLFVIVFIICMAIFLYFWVRGQVQQDEQRRRSRR
jgi:uncharacterized membrane protein